MGDSRKYWADKEAEEAEERQAIRDADFLEAKGLQLKSIKSGSAELDNMRWFFKNKDKIFRNRKLINLIG